MSADPKVFHVAPDLSRRARVGNFHEHLLECLELHATDAARVEKAYGLAPAAQLWFGYRSCPEQMVTRTAQIGGHDLSSDEYFSLIRKAHAPLYEMSDNEFFDWLTYSKTTIEEIEREHLQHVRWRSDKLPLHQSIIEEELAARLGSVSDVAGAYITDERLRLKLPERSLLVPVKRGGRVRSILCYPRAGEDAFFLLSSNGLPGGTKATPSIHVARPAYAREKGIIILVDHAIQADAYAAGGVVTFVARNGLSAFGVLLQLREEFPKLKGVLIDAVNPDYNLIRKLRDAGLSAEVAENE
jgi:hypothetical protein